MQIKIKVNTNSKIEVIEKITDNSYKVKFNAVREKGEANAKLIKILAKYFNMAPQNIKIVSGFTGTNKIITLDHFQR
jgi:uncharacterized protein YggU (UPF0235/DUF167 family)